MSHRNKAKPNKSGSKQQWIRDSSATKRSLSSPEEIGNNTKKNLGDNMVDTQTNAMDVELRPNQADDINSDQGLKAILLSIQGDIKSIKADIGSIKSEIVSMQNSLEFLSAKYEDQKVKITNLKEENDILKSKLREQEQHIENIDQYNRRQNIIFDSIIEKHDENTDEIIVDQCRKIGIVIEPADIQVSHRMSAKNIKGKPRPIIVRFASVGKARSIITAVKHQFKKTVPPTTPRPPDQIVHAREHLTDRRAKLLTHCLQLRKAGHLHAVWTYNHHVYVKRLESDTKGVKICDKDELQL